MLKPLIILEAMTAIRAQNNKAKIILYTALLTSQLRFILSHLYGITITFHSQKDVKRFASYQYLFDHFPKKKRLNVFKGIDISDIDTTGWQIKKDMTWIKNSPLPEGEVLMRYK